MMEHYKRGMDTVNIARLVYGIVWTLTPTPVIISRNKEGTFYLDAGMKGFFKFAMWISLAGAAMGQNNQSQILPNSVQPNCAQVQPYQPNPVEVPVNYQTLDSKLK